MDIKSASVCISLQRPCGFGEEMEAFMKREERRREKMRAEEERRAEERKIELGKRSREESSPGRHERRGKNL